MAKVTFFQQMQSDYSAFHAASHNRAISAQRVERPARFEVAQAITPASDVHHGAKLQKAPDKMR
jgi:hypothetical protein